MTTNSAETAEDRRASTPRSAAGPPRDALPRLLLQGLDTVQCCYYLAPEAGGGIDTEKLLAQREGLRQADINEAAPVSLGNREFLLAPHGSRSGYPFILNDADFRIEFGPRNKPSFVVTFRSEALWRDSAPLLHQIFLDWAASAGYHPVKPETLTRVDFSFDYHLEAIDFDEDSFVTLSSKDSQHRESGQIQTFTFGRSDVVLRMYDKVAEIQQQSGKVWLFDLWGQEENVWRIEWQVRKAVLRRFGITTLQDLQDRPKPLLRYLATTHDSLRIRTGDSNRSRWPLHPLWADLQAQIEQLSSLGTPGPVDRPRVLAYRMMQMAVAVHGYLKRMAAVRAVQTKAAMVDQDEALRVLRSELLRLNDPLSWKVDVGKRIKEIELGAW